MNKESSIRIGSEKRSSHVFQSRAVLRVRVNRPTIRFCSIKQELMMLRSCASSIRVIFRNSRHSCQVVLSRSPCHAQQEID